LFWRVDYYRVDYYYDLTVAAWRHRCNAPENAGQMMLIGEAARYSNSSQGRTGIAHQGLRSLYSPVKQGLIGRLPCALAKIPNEV